MNRGLLIAVLLGLMLLHACVSAAGASAALTPIAGSPPASDFTLPDLTGHRHSLSDYRGTVVMINFWATWCAPCREEMPAMEGLYQDLRVEGLEILAIHTGPAGEAIPAFLEQVPVSFPVLVDADLELRGWQVPALPTTVVVDRQGRSIYRAVGPRDWESPLMQALLREILDR